MSRRVVIGKLPNGTIRLRTALPGYDALTAPDSSDYISFDSNWTDLVKVHLAGRANLLAGPITFANLGYKPFVEIRPIMSGVIWDDTLYNYHDADYDIMVSGYQSAITTTSISGGYYTRWEGETPYYYGNECIYVVYKVPSPL